MIPKENAVFIIDKLKEKSPPLNENWTSSQLGQVRP